MWRGERCTSACGAPASSSARGCLHGRIPTFLHDGSHSMPRPPKPPQVASAVSSSESNDGYDRGTSWGLVRVAQVPKPRKSAMRSGRSSSASVARSGVRCWRQLPLFRGTWCRSAVAQVVKAVSVPGDASDRALESKTLRKSCRALHQRSQSPTAAEHRCQAGCAELWDHLTSSPVIRFGSSRIQRKLRSLINALAHVRDSLCHCGCLSSHCSSKMQRMGHPAPALSTHKL